MKYDRTGRPAGQPAKLIFNTPDEEEAYSAGYALGLQNDADSLIKRAQHALEYRKTFDQGYSDGYDQHWQGRDA